MEIAFDGGVALVTGATPAWGWPPPRRSRTPEPRWSSPTSTNPPRSRRTRSWWPLAIKPLRWGCDVGDEDEVAAMVDQTVAVFGRLDAAFNNAGTMTENIETADASGDEFDRVAAVNLRGVWNCMKHELRHMRTQGSGAIVNSGHQPGLVMIGSIDSGLDVIASAGNDFEMTIDRVD